MKNKKQKKIKRYSPFVDKQARRRRVRRGLLVVLGLGVLFSLGWFLASRYMDGGFSWPERQPDTTSAQVSSVASESGGPQSEAESSAPEQQQGAAELGYWAEVPHEALAQDRLAETVAALRQAGVSHAVITLKDETGYLYYDSALDMAAGSRADGGFDAGAVASALLEAGINPVAEIYAYRDHLAPYNNRAAAVQLNGNANYLWLDAAAANGGKPWLNAYASEAQAYAAGILDEALGLGYSDVLMRALQLPEAYSLDQASFGNVDDTAARTLAATALDLEQRAAQAGGRVWFGYPSGLFADADNSVTGYNPASFGVARFVVEIAAGSGEGDYYSGNAPADRMVIGDFADGAEANGALERGFSSIYLPIFG